MIDSSGVSRLPTWVRTHGIRLSGSVVEVRLATLMRPLIATTPVVIWRDELRVYELTSQTLMFDFDKKYEDNLKLIHTHYGFEISLIGAPIRAAVSCVQEE